MEIISFLYMHTGSCTGTANVYSEEYCSSISENCDAAPGSLLNFMQNYCGKTCCELDGGSPAISKRKKKKNPCEISF